MTKTILMATAAIVLTGGLLVAGYGVGIAAQPAAAQAATPAPAASDPQAAPLQRADIERIVRDYLVANPEVLEEMQVALDTKKKEAERVASLKAIGESRADIFNSGTDGIVGNPNGKVTIVEFYDYNCGYCKHAQADMLSLTQENPDLRFVLKEFPILGPDSQKAHVVSQAFHRLMPEKYAEFHNTLLGSKTRATEAAAMQVALSLGADEAKLRAEMAKPDINDVFAKTYRLAEKLQITGTPSYVVGNEVVFGALGKDVLAEKIAEAKAACTSDTNC